MGLLALDIGNTTCVFGYFDQNDLRAKWQLSSAPAKTDDEYDALISFQLSKHGISPQNISAVVICSVVPALNELFSELAVRLTGNPALFIGKDLLPAVDIQIYNPHELGMDRWINAFAGYREFGVAQIILDFGTAVTFDIVSDSGAYLGGIILPGPRIALEALSNRTAQLPRTGFAKPTSIIGKSTVECMQSGAYFGSKYMFTGLIEHLKEEMLSTHAESSPLIIATGGASRSMVEMIGKFDHIRPNLTLQGILFAYLDSKHSERTL